jgi:hypothetical protein
MRWLPVLFALLAGPTVAADFRVLNFGGPCADAPKLEKALRSVQISDRSGPNQQTFRGTVFDREVTIQYLCQNGELIIGNYIFPKQTFEAATETLQHVYDGLRPIYGPPFINTSPWQYGLPNVDPRRIESDPQSYHIAWQDDRVFLTIHLSSPSKDKTAADWLVLAAFGRSKK